MKELSIEIKVVTGLHIGGTTTYEIAGLDNVVIKDKEGYPYIPGSSLKGKLRSLLETMTDLSGLPKDSLQGDNIGPCSCGQCVVCKVFGYVNPENKTSKRGNIIFRDLHLKNKPAYPSEILEIKYETAIDRASGRALQGSLRQTERVIPGQIFGGKVVISLPYNVSFSEEEKKKIRENWTSIMKKNENDFQATSGEELVQRVLEIATALLEMDYLGGNGTRGYGQVKIELK